MPRRIRAIVGVAACMNRAGTRSLTALYVAAPFSMGYVDFYTFLMPLYALSLGFDAAEVGILVGARSIVAMFLSIHIGVLMDRFGTRKVTLFFVWISIVLAPLFPLVPWFWSLLVLQPDSSKVIVAAPGPCRTGGHELRLPAEAGRRNYAPRAGRWAIV
jgi:nitrate/nitrite transporter NarK